MPFQNIKASLEKEMCKCFIRELKPEIEQRVVRNLNAQKSITDALRIETEICSVTDLRQGALSKTQNRSRETVKFVIKRAI